ncbi:MAG: hypothetical protein JWP69_1653 [Flaviaesturariibacter sp.]|nr:hypothetical protein [Flaviaesturariibacter sp.]
MLNSISWQSYWTALVLSTTVYYIVLYLRFFGSSIRFRSNRRGPQKKEPSAFSVPFDAPADNTLPDRPALRRGPAAGGPVEEVDETVLHGCLDELTAFFEAAGAARLERTELLAALQVILAKYPALSHSTFRETITGLLVSQCKHYCALELSEGDLWRVWSGS